MRIRPSLCALLFVLAKNQCLASPQETTGDDQRAASYANEPSFHSNGEETEYWKRAASRPTVHNAPSRQLEKRQVKSEFTPWAELWLNYPVLTWTWKTIRTFRWIDQTPPLQRNIKSDEDAPTAALQWFGHKMLAWLKEREKYHPHYPDEAGFARYDKWIISWAWTNENRFADHSGTLYPISPEKGVWPEDERRPSKLQVIPQQKPGQTWEDGLLEVQPRDSDETLESWMLKHISKGGIQSEWTRLMLPGMDVRFAWGVKWQPNPFLDPDGEWSKFPDEDVGDNKLEATPQNGNEGILGDGSQRKPLQPSDRARSIQ
ncbi:MAG: hypothetical protein M1831_001544 [Alyxoria varia]|nr:MAG: hypothetical protein M1831_001544 [Alyxoria varia]